MGAGLGVLAHDGDDGGEVGGVAREPGGLVLLGGAGLAGGGPAGGLGGGAGAALDDARRTDVVVSAASRLTACSVLLPSGSSMSSSPSLVILSTRVYVPCRPWLARVAYASAMSRTLAVAGPSAMEGVRGEVGGVLGQAEGDGGLLDLAGADVDGHLRVDGVDGLVGGGGDGDVAVVDARPRSPGRTGAAVQPWTGRLLVPS